MMLLKKLDTYILKKFLGTFIYSIAIISVIIIIFDISEKLEGFIKHHAPFALIIKEYYINFIPYLVNLFSPLFTFISVVFFTSRMAARSEIIAILGGGTSFWRLLYPYMIGAFLIASMSLYLNNFLIPDANKIRLRFESTYLNDRSRNTNVNIHKQISPGVYIYMEHFDNFQNVGYRFSLEHISKQTLPYKLMAETIRWDSAKKNWRISDYYIRRIMPDGTQKLSSGMNKDTVLNLVPSDFAERPDDVQAMNYKELNTYIEKKRMEGSSNIAAFEVEKDQRNAFPFATFILTIIGVSLSSRKVRGGTGLHLGVGLMIAFSFILFMQVSTTFAAGGFISPLISVWIPNFIYGIVAYFMLRWAPK
jgi:lipopolysaccharide export system permease protein